MTDVLVIFISFIVGFVISFSSLWIASNIGVLLGSALFIFESLLAFLIIYLLAENEVL